MSTSPMFIDFISDGIDQAPILRITGHDILCARELFHAIRSIRDSMGGVVLIDKLSGFKGLEVRLEYSSHDVGVLRSESGYKCLLSYDGWMRVEGLLAPFCSRSARDIGFQWLDETSDISLLYTEDGVW